MATAKKRKFSIRTLKKRKNFVPRLWAEILKLAKENPTFRYHGNCPFPSSERCQYTRRSSARNAPRCSGCIVGRALTRMGWDRKDAPPNEDVRSWLGLRKDDPIVWKIMEAQMTQDCNEPWGNILKLEESDAE